MGTFLLKLLLTAAFSYAALANSVGKDNKDTRSDQISSECGGILRDYEGEIWFKFSGSDSTNQRCIWIIETPFATEYTIAVEYLQANASIIVSGFNYQRNATHFYPTVAKSVVVPDSKFVVVTFYSSNVTQIQAGFRLNYKGEMSVDSNSNTLTPIYYDDYSWFSRHFYFKRGMVINYPIVRGRTAYSNNELSCFAFLPPNNMYQFGLTTKFCYRKLGLEGSCYDHITIYKFSSSKKWQIYRRLCGDVLDAHFEHDDLILAVFESDGTITGEGFKLDYSCY